METKLKILNLEDSPRDAEIVQNMLQGAGFEIEVDVVGGKAEYEKFLNSRKYDIIFSDYSMPGYNGSIALEMRNQVCPEVPFIFISGTLGEELAIKLLKEGADDYLLKDRLERLPSAVKRAIEEAREKAALKLAHEKLKLASENWSSTFNAIQDGIFLLDADQKIIEVNQAFLTIIGKTREEIIGQHCWPFVHGTSCAIDNCPFVKSKVSIKREVTELIIGESEYEIMIDPIFDENNTLTGAVHIIADITSRKKSEKALHENEELLSLFIKNSPIYTYIKEVTADHSRMLSVSDNFIDLSGIPAADMVGNTLEEIVPSEMAAQMYADDLKVFSEGKVVVSDEDQDGRNYTSIKFPMSIGSKKLLAGYTIDITERKKAENLINEKEASLRYAQEIAKMGSWKQNLITHKAEWSENSFKMFGYKPYEFEPTFEHFKNSIHPDDLHIFEESFDDMYKNRTEHRSEMRIVLPDGNIKWLQTNMVPVFMDNKLVELIGTNIDITERKQAESIMHDIIEKNPMSIQIVDKDGFTLQVNPAHTKLFGALPPPGFSIFSDSQLMQQGLVEEFKNLRKGEVVNFPDSSFNAHDLKDSLPDSEIWVRAIAFPLYENKNEPEQFVIMHENITEHKKYEIALKESEEKYRNIFDNVQDVFYQTDLAGIVHEISPSIKYFTEFTRDEIIGKPVHWLYYNPDDRALLLNELQKKGELKDYELILKPNKEGKIYVSINARLIMDAQGNPHHIDGALRDISARKHTEEILERTNKKHQELLDSISDVFFSFDKDLRCTYWNKASEKLLGISAEDAIGKTLVELYPDKTSFTQIKEMYLQVIKTKNPQHLTINYPANDNLTLDITAYPNADGVSTFIKDITESKMQELAIIESKKTAERYLNIAAELIMSLDTKGNIIMVNESGLKLLGYQQDELIGKNWFKTCIPDGYSSETASLYDSIMAGEDIKHIENQENQIITKSGETKTIYFYINLLKNTEGEITGIICSGSDITESKKAEESIRESEERFRKIFEESQIGMIISGADFRFEKVNPAFCKMLGYTADELIKNNYTQITHPDDVAKDLECIKKLEQGEIPFYKVEKRYLTKNGEIIWGNVVVTNIRDTDGKILYYLAMIEDVTERRQIEAKLQASKDYLDKIINTVAYPIIVKDEEHKFYLVNNASCEMFGHTKEDIIGKSDLDFFPEEQAKEFLFRDKEVLFSGKENKNEEVLTDAAGNLRTLITTKTLYTDNNGKKFVVGIINDISERKQMELELVKAKDRAEESDRLKSAFLANMSHEIRTPMNGILGFAELLKEPNLKSEKQQEFIGIIEKSGIRLLNIINNLVNISKIESGLMNTYVSELNVNDQIEYIYNFFKPEIEKKGMQIFTRMGLSTKEAVVTSDREKIIAILTNLVGNAIKFTEKGSIELGYVKKASRLEFYVKDTGRGIRHEQKEFIFERFRQGSESLSRNYEGAGLGLSISKSYVEMLGGKMWVESDEGIGSTFYFTIPYEAGLEEKEVVVISTPAIREGKNIQNKNLKVLVAEDDDISLFLVTLEVKAFAKEIYTATSGTEAVKICRNNSDIDLILMDIKMQEMDGYEATRQIRQFNKDVIIIAQTAFGLVGDREKAIAAGCNDYIAKPLDIYRLRELIKTYFK